MPSLLYRFSLQAKVRISTKPTVMLSIIEQYNNLMLKFLQIERHSFFQYFAIRDSYPIHSSQPQPNNRVCTYCLILVHISLYTILFGTCTARIIIWNLPHTPLHNKILRTFQNTQFFTTALCKWLTPLKLGLIDPKWKFYLAKGA